MRRNQNQETAARLASSIFEEEISNAVISKFGGSYSTYSEIHSSWRKTFPYYKEIEDFIIAETKTYIRNLDSRKSDSTNPQFLHALVILIANFLSLYTMRASSSYTRKKARKILEDELYTNFSYIQNLIARQLAMREYREKSKRNTYKKPARKKQKQLLENAKIAFNNKRSALLIANVNIKTR